MGNIYKASGPRRKTDDLRFPVEYDNLLSMFESTVRRFPNRDFLGAKGVDGKYYWLTYGKIAKRVDDLRTGLASLGVGKKDLVGIISNNRPEWVITAYAVFGLGATLVPMYEVELESFWRFVIEDSAVKVLLVATREIYEKVKGFVDEIETLEEIVVIESAGEGSLAELEMVGAGAGEPVKAITPSPDDIATLMYTSGTTGHPKGVLLSHGNVSSNVYAGLHITPELNETCRSLAILPWAHSMGQTAELYNFATFGGAVGIMGSLETVVDDMAAVKPTHLITVPKIFNKIYDAIWSMMRQESFIKRGMFEAAVRTAERRRVLAGQGRPSRLVNIAFGFFDLLVFKKIRAGFGGKITGAIDGSATMNVRILHFFWDIGIPIYDCYGLTEASPAVAMNYRDEGFREGSVGMPIEDVTIVIDREAVEEGAEDGEIIVYGPNVMQGYHNRPEETAKVMTADGGLRTGDRGRLDEDGFLYITGRIKEQYKLVNGKYVFPVAMEEEIKLVPVIEDAFVYGENREENVCLVYPNFEVLEVWAKENDLPTDRETLVSIPEVLKLIRTEVAGFLEGKFAHYEIPRKFKLIMEEFTVENRMLTQTMKHRRKSIIKRYAREIDSLYEDWRRTVC